MKIRLNFEKTNLIRLIVAMIFAAVLYFKVTFPVYVLAGFGVSYFLIKSLSVELNNKWLRLALGILMLGGSSVMTAHMVQYLLLDAELRARIMGNKMFLNILCLSLIHICYLPSGRCESIFVFTCFNIYTFTTVFHCGSVFFSVFPD